MINNDDNNNSSNEIDDERNDSDTNNSQVDATVGLFVRGGSGLSVIDVAFAELRYCNTIRC